MARSFPCPVHCQVLTAESLGEPLCKARYWRCRRKSVAAAGAEFHRWKLGINQSRLHHASRTCGTDLPTSLRALPLRRHAPFLIAVSPPGWPVVLGGASALDLLPLRGDLMCAETAHHNIRYGIADSLHLSGYGRNASKEELALFDKQFYHVYELLEGI